jgi:hypothetical protein
MMFAMNHMTETNCRRRSTLLGLLLACAAFIALPGESHAGTNSWGSGSGTPSVSELVPKMSDDESYTERYSFSTNLDNGGHIGLDLTISNLGWGDAHGASTVRIKWPGRTKYAFKKKVGEDEWTHSKSHLDIDIADTRVTTTDGNKIRLRHKSNKVEFDITFRNRIPMWQPGTGQITTEDGYHKFNLIAPRADVTGEITFGDKTYDVKGSRSGYGEHVATNIAPYDFADRFSRFRDYDDDIFVMWREIKLTEDYGGKSVTWILIGYKDKIVFSDANASMRFARMRKDSESGYRFPMALQIDAKNGADEVKLVMKGRRFKRKDLLESYGSAVKSIASTVAEPYQFDIKCNYQMQMTVSGATAKVSGKGHYVMDYIND